jgi:hypothetical protein
MTTPSSAALRPIHRKPNALAYDPQHALNAVCPYFTMFPLEFPLTVLKSAPKTALVADPFCGRGTTVYAARYLGLQSFGIDSSPIAVAIARAKTASSTVGRIVRLARDLLDTTPQRPVPQGEFWRRAYHASTLEELCRLRAGLASGTETQTSVLLRAILLGVLHGPLSKSGDRAGYLSNQMPRTFAPKPDYAARYWSTRRLKPPRLSVIDVIRRKAERVLASTPGKVGSSTQIRCGDSRQKNPYRYLKQPITHVVTSPPYYGVRTYVEDQWLRYWLLGGPDQVQYGGTTQLSHESPEAFARSLALVWDQIAERSISTLPMAIRFGSIKSRESDPQEILLASLRYSQSYWRVRTMLPSGAYRDGRRQADQMIPSGPPAPEYDFYLTRRPR